MNINFYLDFQEIWDKYLYYVIAAIAVIVILIVVIIILVCKKHSKKKVEIEKENVFGEIIACLGGKENITKCDAKGSRLNVVLVDPTKLEEEKVKGLGVTSIIKMTSKITLIIGTCASEIADLINK